MYLYVRDVHFASFNDVASFYDHDILNCSDSPTVWYSLLFHIIPCDNPSFSHSQITSAIFFFFFFY